MLLFVCIAALAWPMAESQAQPLRRYQSAHFLLTADASAPVDRLLEDLEDAHRALRRYGLDPGARVRVVLHRTVGEFAGATNADAGFTAIAIGHVVHLQPVATLYRRAGLMRTLRHELAHVALAPAAGNGLPRWLNEGIAIDAASQRYVGTMRFETARALDDSLRLARSAATLRASYAVASELTEVLIRRHGRREVLRLALLVARHGGFEGRFRRLTGHGSTAWTDRELRATR